MTSVERTSPKQIGSLRKEAQKEQARIKDAEGDNIVDADAAKDRERGRGRDKDKRRVKEALPNVDNDSSKRKVHKEIVESGEEARWSPPGDVYGEFKAPEKRKPLRREKTNNRIRDIQRPKLPPLSMGHVVDPVYSNRMETPERTPVTRTASVSSLKSLSSRLGERLNLNHQQQPTETPPGAVSSTTPVPKEMFRQRFKCVRKIDEGAQGKVYFCEDRDSGKTYAVKVMIPAAEERRRKRQELEREIMRLFSEDKKRPASIIEYVGTYNEDEDPFTGEKKPRICHVMEHCKGPTLSSVLKHNRFSDCEVIRLICIDIAAGLRFMHSKDIVHCDLKPENIMFVSERQSKETDGFHIRIIDFGLSIRLTTEWTSKDVGGTLLYHPPELFKRERRASKKMDMWAFGVILWETIHGLNSFPIAPISYQGAKRRAEARGIKGNEEIRKFWKEYNAKQFEKRVRFNSDRWRSMPDAKKFGEQLLKEDPVERLPSDGTDPYLNKKWNMRLFVSSKL